MEEFPLLPSVGGLVDGVGQEASVSDGDDFLLLLFSSRRQGVVAPLRSGGRGGRLDVRAWEGKGGVE